MLITHLIPIGEAAFILAILLVIVRHWGKLRADCWGAFKLFTARFFGLWYAFAVVALLFKVAVFLKTIAVMGGQGGPFAAVNIVPFKTIAEYAAAGNTLQIAGNLMVFFPLPALLRCNFPKMQTRDYFLTVFGAVVLIEPLQTLINVIVNGPANVIDIDDFLLNAAGCLLGLLVLKMLQFITRGK
jgi:glycopeptide antibiotics resistance protein